MISSLSQKSLSCQVGGGLNSEMGGQAETRWERTGLDQGRAMKGEKGQVGEASRSPSGQALEDDGLGCRVGMGREASRMQPRALSGSLGCGGTTPNIGTKRRSRFAMWDTVSIRGSGVIRPEGRVGREGFLRPQDPEVWGPGRRWG